MWCLWRWWSGDLLILFVIFVEGPQVSIGKEAKLFHIDGEADDVRRIAVFRVDDALNVGVYEEIDSFIRMVGDEAVDGEIEGPAFCEGL